MDFTLDDEAVAAAAALEPVLQQGGADLWQRVASADLAGLCVRPERGGAGQGVLAAAEMLRVSGRYDCDIPLASTAVVGAAALDSWWQHDDCPGILDDIIAGRCIVASAVGADSAISTIEVDTAGARRMSGYVDAVPHAGQADLLLLPVSSDGREAVAVISARTSGVSAISQAATHGGAVARVELDDVEFGPGQLLGADSLAWSAAHRWVRSRTLVALCALQLGVAEQILDLTRAHVSQRRQFGRPLGAFQSTALRLADAHVAVEALRAHVWRAAWALDEGFEGAGIISAARLWSVRAAQSIVRTGHQLHGGVGVDLDYPLHRFTRRSAWLSQRLGGAPAALHELGGLVADGSAHMVADGSMRVAHDGSSPARSDGGR